MPLGGNWPGSNRNEFRSSPHLCRPLSGLAPPVGQTRSLGQDFTDPKIGIPGGRSRPKFVIGLKR
jgi:hypothetical protein